MKEMGNEKSNLPTTPYYFRSKTKFKVVQMLHIIGTLIYNEAFEKESAI